MLTELSNNSKIVGTNQVKRVLTTDSTTENIDKVFLSKDADVKLIKEIEKMCREKNVSIVYVDSMKMLGDACGVEVNAATAALLK